MKQTIFLNLHVTVNMAEELLTANVNQTSFYSNGSLGGILRCLTQSMINTLGAGKKGWKELKNPQCWMKVVREWRRSERRRRTCEPARRLALQDAISDLNQSGSIKVASGWWTDIQQRLPPPPPLPRCPRVSKRDDQEKSNHRGVPHRL